MSTSDHGSRIIHKARTGSLGGSVGTLKGKSRSTCLLATLDGSGRGQTGESKEKLLTYVIICFHDMTIPCIHVTVGLRLLNIWYTQCLRMQFD